MNKMGIKHIIITRFNLFINDVGSFSQNLSEDWLDSRFNLFNMFCFPSVKNQTDQNFQWFVFFALNTPERFRPVIAAYAKEYANFTPIFTDKLAFKATTYLNEINRVVTTSDKVLITTRLDSDDALGVNFVRNIQSALFNDSDYFIDFPFGNQYDLINKVLVNVKILANPFLTRVERRSGNDSFKTVISIESHNRLGDSSKVFRMNNRNMWLQVVHDKNILNRLIIKSVPVIRTKFFNTKFGLDTFNFGIKNNVSSFVVYVFKYLKRCFIGACKYPIR